MWEMLKTKKTTAREAECLAEFDAWGKGRFPYDRAPSCGSCLTEHFAGCCSDAEHLGLVATLRIEGCFGEFRKEQLGDMTLCAVTRKQATKLGAILLECRGAAIQIRQLYAHLYGRKEALVPEEVAQLR